MMREFLTELFRTREEPFDITLFSVWHIGYAAVIFAAILTAARLLRDRESAVKKRALDTVAVLVAVVYVADFFIQPLFRGGMMNVDKLPFHICTLLCPVIAFTQFNPRFSGIKEPVAFLSIIAPLMYLVYPGSALGSESPFCYEIIQTFVYHGLVLAYGVLLLTTKTVVPRIKNAYRALVGICLTVLWASFGNAVYSPEGWGRGYDWFFITGKTFPFISQVLMPFVVVGCTFGMVLIIYGLYYLVILLQKKYEKKKRY